jgi:hypothetical protein
MNKESTMLTAFGQTKSIQDHLRSLIESQSVTLRNGKEELTEMGRVLEAALRAIEAKENG